jgi:hypothetical protein
MAERSGPFDTGAGSTFQEDDWGKLLRGNALGDGVIYQQATEITSPYTGPAFNGLKVAAAGGLDVTIGVGLANVHGFMYENTSTLTKTHATAPVTAGQTRHDIIVVRLDRTGNTAVVAIVQGTAAATGSQVDPTLAKSAATWEIPLARVSIATGVINITAGMITDARHFAFIPQDIRYCRVVKSGTTQAAGGSAPTWTFTAGNSGLFTGNQFVIPCNGLWNFLGHVDVAFAGGQTSITGLMTVNAVELIRAQGIPSSASFNGVPIGVPAYPFRTGDAIQMAANSIGVAANYRVESFMYLSYAGPSKEPVW